MKRRGDQGSKGVRREEAVREFLKSGMTQVAFCRGRGLAVSTLQNWLRLERSAGGETFQELSLASRPTVSTVVEVVFPDGVAIRVRSA